MPSGRTAEALIDAVRVNELSEPTGGIPTGDGETVGQSARALRRRR